VTVIIHHVTAVGLVLLSARGGYFRIGGVIMGFFDWADPLLLLAKGLKYLSEGADDPLQVPANRHFDFFAVAFILTRGPVG
jgi:hypothetical protein